MLVGPPGAGKTRLAKRISRILAVSFIDTDKAIVAEHGPIATIFETQGEAAFRQLERAEIVRALATDSIVSLGAGAVINTDTQADLANHRVALITVTAEAVAGRIGGPKRPLATDIGAWTALVDSRIEIYERLAHVSWDTSVRPIDTIAAEIAEWLIAHPTDLPLTTHDDQPGAPQ